jgi:aldehyde dehydrogenase (NAD+)
VNDKSLLSFSHGTKEDVDRAVEAARKAFQTTWGNTLHATERAKCEPLILDDTDLIKIVLFRFADLMERDLEKLAQLER